MCWYVYIATSKPLEGVLFTRDYPMRKDQTPPPLHFREVEEGDEKERYIHLFRGKYLYYVGSTSGCSCHLDYQTVSILTPELRARLNISPLSEVDEAYRESNQASPLAFLDFIKTQVQKEGFLEMYALWEDDHLSEPKDRVVIHTHTADLTIEQYFGLQSKCFYTFLN